jgi:peptidoglycan/LPS O-acetylase OafA/YrhL
MKMSDNFNSTAQHSTAQHSTAQHSTAQHSTAQHSTAQHSTAQHSTARINYIDFLKFIGLTGIIIAHIGSPNWLLMLRSFDVPLMVIISSILGEKSYRKYSGKRVFSAKDYFISRIKRLVIPTWIFLTFYFLLMFLASGNHYSLKYYIASYCLTRYGIGYVWIILIYLYTALLLPVFSKLKLSKIGMLIVVLVYCLYEVMYYFNIGVNNLLVDTTLFYIIPYGLLAYLGYNYSHMSNKMKAIVAVISAILFVTFGVYYWRIYGSIQSVQIAKYPPRIYYLSYGAAVSFFLLIICEKFTLKIFNNRFIRYVSMHSMWIYLWHVLILDVYSVLNFPEIWYLKLIVVYLASLAVVFVVNKLLDWIDKYKKIGALKYLRG